MKLEGIEQKYKEAYNVIDIDAQPVKKTLEEVINSQDLPVYINIEGWNISHGFYVIKDCGDKYFCRGDDYSEQLRSKTMAEINMFVAQTKEQIEQIVIRNKELVENIERYVLEIIMNWEVGKFYKTRGGYKAMIYAYYEGQRIFFGVTFHPHGAYQHTWDKDGKSSGGSVSRDMDLTTEEWTEPVKPLTWEGEMFIDSFGSPYKFNPPGELNNKRFRMTLTEIVE